MNMNRPEILAPAGSPETLEAALKAGADAVYLGSGSFHARSQAVSFPLETLAETVETVHRAGAKLYMTMNTLIYQSEWQRAFETVATAYQAGVDALIVQDLGLAKTLHELLPDFELHASTQMAIHAPEALRLAAQLGIKRVVLPRELSLDELTTLTRLAVELGLQTEVFVQGALCVCYSGHCHLSRTLGGRSANRGACAQPCRHAYRVVGRSEAYQPILSPKDLSYLDALPALVEAGIHSLKIEGRMRSPEYVATAVNCYRQALEGQGIKDRDRQDLLQAFNRGGSFSQHRLYRLRGRDFLSGTRSGNLGIYLGKTHRIDPQKGYLEFKPQGIRPVKGDTLVLRDAQGRDHASAPIGEPEWVGENCRIRGFHPEKLRRLPEPTWIYRARSFDLTQQVAHLTRPPQVVDLQLCRHQNQARLILRDLTGQRSVQIDHPLEAVTPLSPQRAQQQLGKLGQSGLQARTLDVEGPIPLKISQLNAMRREAVEAFLKARHQPRTLEDPVSLAQQWRESGEGREVSLNPSQQGAPDSPRQFYVLPGWRATDGNKPLSALKARHAAHLSATGATSTQAQAGALGWILPLASLLKLPAQPRQKLFQSESIWVAVPSGAPLALYEAGSKQYDEWLKEGLKGQFTSGLVRLGALRTADLPPEDWGLFPDANVANLQTAIFLNKLGVTRLAWAPEVRVDQTLPDWLAKAPASLQFLWPDGEEEAMLFEHCPVGYGEAGCQQCQHQRVFELEDVRGRRFPYLPLPDQACSGRLYAPSTLQGAVPESSTIEADRLAWLTTVLPESDEKSS